MHLECWRGEAIKQDVTSSARFGNGKIGYVKELVVAGIRPGAALCRFLCVQGKQATNLIAGCGFLILPNARRVPKKHFTGAGWLRKSVLSNEMQTSKNIPSYLKQPSTMSTGIFSYRVSQEQRQKKASASRPRRFSHALYPQMEEFDH